MTEKPDRSPYRLEDLVLLHREIAELVRAGIPLELGLQSFSQGLPTRLGRLAGRISHRMSEGVSLADAVEAEGMPESSVYASVISAGVRSGQLPEALEALADTSEQNGAARRTVLLSLVYPTCIAVVGYLLFLLFIFYESPRYLAFAEDFGFANRFAFRLLKWLIEQRIVVAILGPVFIGLFVYVFLPGSGSRRGWLRLTSMSHSLDQAQFGEILRIQLEHGLPLPESFIRAARSTKDWNLNYDAWQAASAIERGRGFGEVVSTMNSIAPMMQWVLSSSQNEATLVQSLRLMCDSYRRRAVRQANWLTSWFPIISTLFFGGTIVILYSLIFFSMVSTIWLGIGTD